MVSPEIVRRRLRLLERYLKRLRQIRDTTDLATFLADSDRQDIAERNLQLAIEAVLDIGQHIIASSSWGPVEEYADVFSILAKHNVLPEPLLPRVRNMSGFRNLLVHEYAELDHARVFEMIQTRLDDLEELARVFHGLL